MRVILKEKLTVVVTWHFGHHAYLGEHKHWFFYGFKLDGKLQDLIIGSVQSPHITVQGFSQTDLFFCLNLPWINIPQEPQWPITSTDLIFDWRHDFPNKVVFYLPMRFCVDLNWLINISKEKKPKNKPVCKNAAWELHACCDGLLKTVNIRYECCMC